MNKMIKAHIKDEDVYILGYNYIDALKKYKGYDVDLYLEIDNIADNCALIGNCKDNLTWDDYWKSYDEIMGNLTIIKVGSSTYKVYNG